MSHQYCELIVSQRPGISFIHCPIYRTRTKIDFEYSQKHCSRRQQATCKCALPSEKFESWTKIWCGANFQEKACQIHDEESHLYRVSNMSSIFHPIFPLTWYPIAIKVAIWFKLANKATCAIAYVSRTA